MKKLFLIVALILGMLCLASCASEDKDAEGSNLDGKGLDDIMQVEIPAGYEQEKNVIRNEDGGELISIHYGKDDNSIYYLLLSYKGQTVMGSGETFEEWYEESKDIIAEEISIDNADSDACIYPIGFNSDESTTGEYSVIEAVFSYHDYLIMVGMENDNGDPITDEQKTTFSNLLNSIRFVE